ncbi:MAG: hypothetical protein UZ03_NOB001003646 [Nitrospira sp. OLB3]|nr:MAG: hypothetical protein UZ03_NOB001003646 [Nitrospira sp. OLB3]
MVRLWAGVIVELQLPSPLVGGTSRPFCARAVDGGSGQGCAAASQGLHAQAKVCIAPLGATL